MPDRTLIRVVTQKQGGRPRPQHFTLKTFFGKKWKSLERNFKSVEVTEICISNRTGQQSTIYDELTKEELERLSSLFPHLKVDKKLPPEPKPLQEKPSLVNQQVVDNDKKLAEKVEETELEEVDYSTWKVSELKDLLKNNDIDFDGRKKKKDYYLDLVKSNNL